jgi:hypothetical protein
VTVPVKVLLVDDHPLARRGVASLVAEAFPVNEIREAGTTGEAITIATAFQPEPADPGPARCPRHLRDSEGAEQPWAHRDPDRAR